jgi:hypothetical protein
VTALLTASRLRAERVCPRLHWIQYELGYRPAVAAHALAFGTLVHSALEAWWRAYGTPAALNDGLAVIQAAKDVDPFDLARAREMLRGYDARWQGAPYKVIAVEQQFETSLVNPLNGIAHDAFRLAGKIDAIVRDEQGRYLVVEHKTSGEDISPGSEYYRRLRLDSQISVYVAGARALGFDVTGCIYDVLGKPKLKPLKANTKRAADETPDEHAVRVAADIAENPSDYYQRAEIVRLEEEMTEAMLDVWQTAERIQLAERAQRAPKNPDSCVRFGRLCEFWAVCSGEASLCDNPAFKKTVAHPELEAA